MFCFIYLIFTDDYRFKDRFSKQNNRTVIHMWAEKELQLSHSHLNFILNFHTNAR